MTWISTRAKLAADDEDAVGKEKERRNGSIGQRGGACRSALARDPYLGPTIRIFARITFIYRRNENNIARSLYSQVTYIYIVLMFRYVNGELSRAVEV